MATPKLATRGLAVRAGTRYSSGYVLTTRGRLVLEAARREVAA